MGNASHPINVRLFKCFKHSKAANAHPNQSLWDNHSIGLIIAKAFFKMLNTYFFFFFQNAEDNASTPIVILLSMIRTNVIECFWWKDWKKFLTTMFQFTHASTPLKCNAILMRPKILIKKNYKKENCFETKKLKSFSIILESLTSFSIWVYFFKTKFVSWESFELNLFVVKSNKWMQNITFCKLFRRLKVEKRFN